MAYNLALITDSKTHTAPTKTKAALEGMGHTVTLYTPSEVTDTNLLTHDAILQVRSTCTSDIITKLKGYLNEGIPIINGLTQGTTLSHSVELGIASTVSQPSNIDSILIDDNTSTITDVYTIGQSVTVYPSATYVETANTPPASAAKLALRSGFSNAWMLLLLEKGAENASGETFGAGIVHIAFLYGLNDYTADGKSIIDKSIKWAIDNTAAVGGGGVMSIRRYVQFI